MNTTVIEVPNEILHVTRMNSDDLRRELAIHLFQQGWLSLGKAAEMAEASVWEFQQTLAARGIALHYGVAEYEDDLATLHRLDRI